MGRVAITAVQLAFILGQFLPSDAWATPLTKLSLTRRAPPLSLLVRGKNPQEEAVLTASRAAIASSIDDHGGGEPLITEPPPLPRPHQEEGEEEALIPAAAANDESGGSGDLQQQPQHHQRQRRRPRVSVGAAWHLQRRRAILEAHPSVKVCSVCVCCF